jgi:hypothetical protein
MKKNLLLLILLAWCTEGFCQGIIILPNANVTVKGSSFIKTTGTAGLIIKSNGDGTGSLISQTSNGVSISASGVTSVERYEMSQRWYLISPAANQLVKDFIDFNKVIPYWQLTDLTKDQYGIAPYNTSENQWDPYFSDSNLKGPDGTNYGKKLGVGIGYKAHTLDLVTPNPTTLTFRGALNLGTTSVTVTTGWNCIGNPYTSAIKINNATNSFLSLNNTGTLVVSSLDPSHTAVYFWNNPQSRYDPINLTSSETWAQSGQGFFVKVKSNLKTEDPDKNDFVTFTSDMQVHKGTEELKSAVSYPKIKLMVSANLVTASTDIKFIDGTTKGLDVGYDAGLFRADQSLNLYTRLVEDNGVEFQLQCLPTNQYKNMVIPVGIDSKSASEIVFTVETVQLDPNCKVILEDKLTRSFTDLSKNSYKTTVAANTATSERFFLHTGDIISGIDDQVLEGKVTAYAKGNKEIRVLGEVGEGAVATLVNGLGQVVLTKRLNAGNLNFIGLPNLSSGIYFLNIKENGTPQTIKLMILK